jgi:drug/metabolite transporter (DMT)-like permease
MRLNHFLLIKLCHGTRGIMESLKYSLIVFIGACSYGVLSTFVKLAYRDGFTVGEVIGSQYFFGWCILLVCTLIFSRIRLSAKKWITLVLVGTTTSLTGIFYGLSLETLPASVAVVLLFQFTWIGVLIESLVAHSLPGREKVFSVLLLFLGTFLAGGFVRIHEESYTVQGICYGLLAAFAFALFILVSGKTATDIPSLNRSFFMITGALFLLLLVYSPSFLYSSALSHGLWKYGLVLSVFGILIPVFCYAIGAPKIGSGLSSILGSAELPSALLMSVFVLQEHVSFAQWVGIGLILMGISLPQVSYFLHRGKDC